MSRETSDRDRIIHALRLVCEPLAHVNAMWLAGSTAFSRDDAWSDIDVVFDVADGTHGDVFDTLERALQSISPIAHRLVIPEPAWHGHSQRVYQLHDLPEYLMIDAVIMQRGSDGPRFDERAIHGEPVVIFDKLGVIRSVEVDEQRHRQAMAAHYQQVRTRFFLLRHMPAKEAARGNELDALWRYQNFVLSPLISLLRTRYAPLFHDFSPRYLKLHLPDPVYTRLQSLSFIARFEDLPGRIDEAIAWAEETIAWLDRDGAIDELSLDDAQSSPSRS